MVELELALEILQSLQNLQPIGQSAEIKNTFRYKQVQKRWR